MTEWIEVGKIVAAHSLKGWVRVRSLSDFPERLTEPGPRWLRRHAQADPMPTQLLEGHYYPSKKLYLVLFEIIADRTAAEQWTGGSILVMSQDRPHLEEEEYYYPDLIGLEVFHREQRLGSVTAVIPAGNDVLEVTGSDGKIWLIPFVKAIVPLVDLQLRRIEVDPPAGLLEDRP